MKKRKHSRKKFNFDIKRFLYSLFFLSALGYIVFFLYTFLNIKTNDPLEDNLSEYAIISSLKDDLDKTVYIFETGEGEDVRISDVYVHLVNKEKEASVLIYIPGSLYFNELEEDFGSPVAISSLFYAGEYLQEGRGVEYTLWYLQRILGFKFDEYIWFKGDSKDTISSVYGDTNEVRERFRDVYISNGAGEVSDPFLKLHILASNYSHIKTFFRVSEVKELEGNIYSNINFVRLLSKIDQLSRSLEFENSYAIDMNGINFSEEGFSDLGGQIRSIDLVEYDEYLKKYYLSVVPRNVEKERAQVEVYNASGVSGIANLYARRVSNNGCDVVRFGNAPQNREKTTIYVSDEEKFEHSYNVISEIFSDRFEPVDQRPSFLTTGDIVILLGEDIVQAELF